MVLLTGEENPDSFKICNLVTVIFGKFPYI